MNVSRESIFLSSIRAFSNALFAVIGIIIGIGALVLFASFLSKGVQPQNRTSLTLLPDAKGNVKLLPDSAPVILQIEIEGIIGQGKMTTEAVQTQLIDAEGQKIKKGRVKGILLHINTPGGTSIDSDGIYRLIQAYKEKHKLPVYAYVGGLCASGGMYIASSTDYIASGPVGVIGSVGVRFGPVFNVVGLMEKYGVEALTLTEGKGKDQLNPFRKWKSNEDENLSKLMDYEYERFVNVVTKARPKLNKEKLMQEYGAYVYAPPEAEQLGYIDNGNSSYEETLTQLVEKAGIHKDQTYQVFQLNYQKPLFSEIFDNTQHLLNTFKPLKFADPYGAAFENKVLYLYQPLSP